MRSAWKTRAERFVTSFGSRFEPAVRSRTARSAVVRNGRAATMARAMRRLSRSSPYLHSTSAISGAPHAFKIVSAVSSLPGTLDWSMRMSRGPSFAYEKPRAPSSS